MQHIMQYIPIWSSVSSAFNNSLVVNSIASFNMSSRMSTGVLTLAPHIICHSGTYDYKFTQGCKTTIYELKMHHYSLLVHWIISESSVNVSSHGLLLTSSAIFENTNVVLVLYELVGTCTVLFFQNWRNFQNDHSGLLAGWAF